MADTSPVQELPVTFQPALYLQRRGWVLDIMRREGVVQVLDVGCAEGELLSCLCNPAPWLAPPPQDVLPVDCASADAEVLAELHQAILHPIKIAGLDISKDDLACTIEITAPRPQEPDSTALWHRAPARWEPLEVNVWQGGLEHFNPAFVAVECIVATEVIEHLPEPVLARFAPVILGAYHPRILLVSTPSYTFNARFTAPDAPPEARSGWRDPSGRTDRVFRHHDHKFEWTVDEFAQWCAGVAEAWGYDVLEIGGVGKALETDEWGRDEALGFASQVAAFKRRERAEWAERRAALWNEVVVDARDMATQSHTLLATHQHEPHAAARQPQPLADVGELVVSKMALFRETAIALTEMWFEREVELACGGWIDWLVRAVRDHEGLSLGRSSSGDEWMIELDPALHHLIPPESQKGAWVSPPDVDEVDDPAETHEGNDTLWEQDAGIVIRDDESTHQAEALTSQDGWGAIDTTFGGTWSWGDPEPGGRWGKDVLAEKWGSVASEVGDWDAPDHST
ncbi:hypothetical protein C8Q76DRAFT_749115 [Earliella scabrosa]|nr:hypothetical protein C8Q76DRAFT_749115 [Earliella scabrosa]